MCVILPGKAGPILANPFSLWFLKPKIASDDSHSWSTKYLTVSYKCVNPRGIYVVHIDGKALSTYIFGLDVGITGGLILLSVSKSVFTPAFQGFDMHEMSCIIVPRLSWMPTSKLNILAMKSKLVVDQHLVC